MNVALMSSICNVTSDFSESSNNILKFSEGRIECRLPEWIDTLIFKDLSARYNPSYDRFSYNLDLSKDECKVYLGTYYPRSFAEWFLIFDTLLKDEALLDSFAKQDKIKILDLGCGAGGECLGLISAFEQYSAKPLNFEIVGVDGNHNSLRIFETIVERFNSFSLSTISLRVAPCYIESEEDLEIASSLIGQDYDFIITSKAIGELESRKRLAENAYEFFAKQFTPLLNTYGLMIILDVTTKCNSTGIFLPQRMNQGINTFLSNNPDYKSIAPCSGIKSNEICRQNCFYKKEIYVTHSHKICDLSKFSIRIITKQTNPISNSHIKRIFNNINCQK